MPLVDDEAPRRLRKTEPGRIAANCSDSISPGVSDRPSTWIEMTLATSSSSPTFLTLRALPMARRSAVLKYTTSMPRASASTESWLPMFA